VEAPLSGGKAYVSYRKTGGSKSSVQLGYQRKINGVTSSKIWEGSWHSVTSGNQVGWTMNPNLASGACIRAVMKTSSDSYISKWRCP
jgi:hypothetical protein